MSDREIIASKVGRLRRTRRFQLILEYFCVGLFWGAIPAALAILVSRAVYLPVSEYLLAGALLAAVTLFFTVRGALVKLTELSVANDIDVTLGLRERISSAMALSDSTKKKDAFVTTLVSDAASSVKDLPLKKVYPWQLPRAWRMALPALAIAAALSFVPHFSLFASGPDREEMRLIQESGKQLKEIAKKLKEEAKEQKDPVLEQHAEEVHKAAKKLEKGQVKKKEALKEMQRLKDKIQTQAESQITPGQRELMSELGKNFELNETTQKLGEALKDGKLQEFSSQLEKLMQDLAEGKISKNQQEFLKDMIKALEETLKSDAAKNVDAEELKKALEALKQSLEQQQQAQKALQETLNKFGQELQQLTQQLDKNNMGKQSQQLNQLMQQMQQQMQQNGSMDPKTLQQMQQALQQTQQQVQNNQQLSQEQKDQLSQECKDCENFFQQQSGEQGEMSEQNQQAQQMSQQMGQQMQQMKEQCSGGT